MQPTFDRVTVIIPCRNAAGTIAAAVRAALAQTVPPIEVIVVDDASSDNSAQIARDAGARVEQLERRCNAGGARNRGMELARGDVLAFLDADVEVAPDWLALVREVLAADSSVAAVGGRIYNGRPGRWGDLDLFLNHSEWIATRARNCVTYPTMAIAYRRDAIGSTRFPATNLGEDTFFARAVQARGGRIRFEPRIRILHRPMRLDWKLFWERQIDAGRQLYLTRRALDVPGRILFRFPILLFLFPHLWIVLSRMLGQGMVAKAVRLFPWLIAGESARIAGFLRQRRRTRRGNDLALEERA
jgi:glycosyltransferase involved in cell wall biosynthesis